jgi:4-coumarate--CoA ligase
VTRGYIVPPIALALAKHPMVDSFDLSSIESLMSGAAPLGTDVQIMVAKR